MTATGEFHYAVEEQHINGERYVEFLQQVLRERDPSADYHHRPCLLSSLGGGTSICAETPQTDSGVFLPTYSPELNPDEQVWNEIKHRQLEKQPIKSKLDLKKRLYAALESLQQKVERIKSFFQLPDTRYAAI